MFALAYWVSFTEPYGTAVAGFVPGYARDSQSPEGLGDHWTVARLIDGPDFLFIPKFRWDSLEEYVVIVASEKFATFSIGPVG